MSNATGYGVARTDVRRLTRTVTSDWSDPRMLLVVVPTVHTLMPGEGASRVEECLERLMKKRERPSP